MAITETFDAVVIGAGFCGSPLGGNGLGRWGYEVGERIAEALR